MYFKVTYLALLRCFSWRDDRALEGADGIDDLGVGMKEWGIVAEGLVDLELLPDAGFTGRLPIKIQKEKQNVINLHQHPRHIMRQSFIS